MTGSGEEDSHRMMWKPESIECTNMNVFRQRINERKNQNLPDYYSLYNWSVEHHDEFWEEFWHFAGINCSKLYDQVVDTTVSMDQIPEWFRGARLNYAENLLCRGNDDDVAIYFTSEGRSGIVEVTFRELRRQVYRYAQALRSVGVEKGDRVVGYIPNCPEAIYAMLAASSIGGVWSSTSPDFGVTGVLDRFRQIRPKVIFSVNGVIYNNKHHLHLDKLDQVVQGLPDLKKVIVIPFIESHREISHISNSCLLDDLLPADHVDEDCSIVYEQLPFNHPLFIMYSSGTTGPPKCMVHSAGGTLIQHMKEHILHGDINRSDKLLQYTTTGWMMWNWAVSVLSTGAAVVLYDGSPFIPNNNVLWKLIDDVGVTVFGTSAKWLAVCDDRGVRPGEDHSLTSLRALLSTGSPLKPETYDYIYTHIKQNLLVGSITGGTDLISCFAGSNPVVPVYRGEIQYRNLAMAVHCWTSAGRAVFDESGELVCTKPFPSMPTSFWNDDDGALYRKAYFSMFKGVWAHGDYCSISSTTGGITMLGRSDGTLNPCGVRFGSAEIYGVVDSFKEISDSLCVGQLSRDGSEERVLLFIKMADQTQFSDDIVRRLKMAIRAQLSARHVPAIILPIDDIPYTHNGKKVEVCVKKILRGEKISERGAFANPDCLDLYANIAELQNW